MEDPVNFVNVATLDNLFEAQRLTFILEEEGIPFAIKSFHDSAYNGLFQSYLGWGIVLASADHEETIGQILEKIRQEPSGQDQD